MSAHAWADYLALTKPRLTALALAAAAMGYFAASAKGAWDAALFHVIAGAALVGGAANALNQFLEKDVDAKMKRTEKRPLPSGRMAGQSALLFGLVCGAAGILYLYFLVNPLTALLGALTISSYVFCYTPLKRKTTLNTFVGAVPGALPILIGWTAAGEPLSKEAWALFAILFLWQIPHFLAIAWVYREDYRKGGLKMFGATDERGTRTAAWILFYSACLFFVSFLPFFLGISGPIYFITALLSGAAFIALGFYMRGTSMKSAKAFVSGSILYLLVLILSMIADKI